MLPMSTICMTVEWWRKMMGRNRDFKDLTIVSENNDSNDEHKKNAKITKASIVTKPYRNKMPNFGVLQYWPKLYIHF